MKRSSKKKGCFVRTVLNAKNDTQNKSSLHGLAGGRFLQLFLKPTGDQPDYLDVDLSRLQPDGVVVKLDGVEVSDAGVLRNIAQAIASSTSWELADYRFEVRAATTSTDEDHKTLKGAEERYPHNLPEAPVHFFGYEQLSQEISARLAHKGLIVFHETGGMGKTTFAKKIAWDALRKDAFPGGAVWINCESNPTLEQCKITMAEVLTGSQTEKSLVDKREKLLHNYFNDNHTLIVFDNFETVLSSDDFNNFLKDHSKKCCIVVTTKEIHDGLKPYVQALGELGREHAIQLFLCEARMKKVSGDEKAAIWHLCEAVGDIPLAVLLLARQAPKTTFSQLAHELQKNTDLLATDDAFLDARHRSMTACFLTSFERLSTEDRDTLFRLSVVPDGLGKQFAAAYLEKSTWLSSLTVGLHSALLKLERDRYVLHPLLKSFLHAQMGARKGEWECCFVDFFCRLLNDATQNPSGQPTPDFLHDEAKNCEEALRAAARSNRYEHLVLVLELLPEAWTCLSKLNLKDFDELAWAQQYDAQVITWLDSVLSKARDNGDLRLQEKLLFLKFIWLSEYYRWPERRGEVLDELAKLNPSRAKALRYSAAARDYIAESEGETSAFEFAETALVNALAIWNELRGTFPGEFEASLINLFTIRSYLTSNKRASETSRTLWKVLAGRSQSKLGWIGTSEMMPEISWANDGTKRLDFLTASNEQQKERFWRLAEQVGNTLFRLEQWVAAEPWLRETLAWKEKDPYNVDLPIWESAAMPLAKTWMKLHRLEEAEGAFYAIARSTARRCNPNELQVVNELNREAQLEIAKIEAQRGDFDMAIRRASSILDSLKHGEFYPYIQPSAKEIEMICKSSAFQEISKMVSKWRQSVKERSKRNKRRVTNA